MQKKAIYKKFNNDLIIGFVIVLCFVLWGLIWFLITKFKTDNFNLSYDPDFNLLAELKAPHLGKCSDAFCFILGSDVHGRSLLELISNGLLYSLGVSFSVSFISSVIGVFVGYFTVFGPRVINILAEFFINIIFVLPTILIAILFMSILGQSLIGLIFTLSFTGWPVYARITRNEILRIRALSYVEGAKAIGMPPFKIFRRVIFPGILPFLTVQFILGLSSVIISESTLGFLGLGASDYSWGSLLIMGKSVLLEAPHVTFVLSLTMATLIIGLNLLGDGLRDHLDPHIKI